MIDLAKKKINFTKLMTELGKVDAERLAAMTPEEREAELIRREEDRRTCRSKSKIIKSLTHKQVKETDIMRSPEEIAAIIDRYNLANLDDLHQLEAHIRRDLPIREILLFADFLHGGNFISSSGKWHRNSSGYVTQTHQEDTALTRLWEGLVRSAHFYIGAASILKMQDARLLGGYAFADEGDGPTLYDYNLDALVRAVPKEYRKQLEMASRLDQLATQGDRIEKTATETRQGVGVLVSKLPDAKKPPTIEEVEAVEIMKAKGGYMTDRTLRNWIKAGKAAKTGTPISWDDLTSTKSWAAWCDTYLAAYNTRTTRKSIISERKAKAEAADKRRRGIIS